MPIHTEVLILSKNDLFLAQLAMVGFDLRGSMRVYLSSTFRDLELCRRAADAAMQRLGCSVRKMESYDSESRSPLSKVREDIRSCDAFVGLYAWRRGAYPRADGNEDVPLPEGIVLGKSSYTEVELAFAREKGIPDFLFLLADDVPWPPGQIEGLAEGDSTAPIQAFRRSIRAGRLVARFRNPDELAGLVATALARVEPTRQFRDALRPPMAMEGGEAAVASYTLESTGLDRIKRGLTTMAALANRGPPHPAVNIDLGITWWSTRFALYAALVRKYSGARCLLITDTAMTDEGSREAFVGLVGIATAIDRLIAIHPQLEVPLEMKAQAPVRQELAAEIDADVTRFKAAFGAGEEAAKLDLTAYHLRQWFGDAMLTRPVNIKDVEAPTFVELALVSGYPHRFVPIHSDTPFQVKPVAVDAPPQNRNCFVVDQSSLATRLSEFYLGGQLGD